jgi:hypothetical protein
MAEERKEGWYWAEIGGTQFPAYWAYQDWWSSDEDGEVLKRECVEIVPIPSPEELALLQRKARAWDRMEATANDVSWRHKSWAITGDVPGLVCLPVDHNGKPVPTYATALEASEAAAMREGGDA